jgi:hypothetical protein
MADPKAKKLKLSVIEIDPDIQPRAKGLDDPTVEKYREDVTNGDEFPPLVVYLEAKTKTHRLSEGFHRAEAYKRAGIKEVLCVIRVGTRRDARLNACGSNATHGLPRSNADKRRAVEMVLEDYPTWSNPRIAKNAGVSAEFVRKVRPAEPGETRETSDGRSYAAQTGASATVADAPDENPSENADLPPETTLDAAPEADTVSAPEPDPVDPADDEPEPPIPATVSVLKDGLGNVIPRHVADTFGDPMLAEAIARIDAVHKELVSIEQHVLKTLARKGEFWPYALCGECAKSLGAAADRAAEASAQLSNGIPFCVCPTCKGVGCKACRNSGAWSRHRYEQRAQYGDNG